MNNFPFIDIFILAMIAIFIINRLRNSLGKKTGNETDIAQKFSQKPSKFTESNPDKEIEKVLILTLFEDKCVKYRETILGSDGRELNPFLAQNNPKSLKSDL